uniref:Uncharacterized protein n=1 Tax=Acrobeloides nanus TaxID=290746 RepID=A0A914C1E2_9BILA
RKVILASTLPDSPRFYSEYYEDAMALHPYLKCRMEIVKNGVKNAEKLVKEMWKPHRSASKRAKNVLKVVLGHAKKHV